MSSYISQEPEDSLPMRVTVTLPAVALGVMIKEGLTPQAVFDDALLSLFDKVRGEENLRNEKVEEARALSKVRRGSWA